MAAIRRFQSRPYVSIRLVYHGACFGFTDAVALYAIYFRANVVLARLSNGSSAASRTYCARALGAKWDRNLQKKSAALALE
jgi:Na+-driven multidrug efflux pump